MPFSPDRLSVVAYADGFTLWHYRGAPDTRAVISANGYFSPAAHMLRSGDMLIAAGSDGIQLSVLAGAGASLRANPL
jgi:hypothetical protein